MTLSVTRRNPVAGEAVRLAVPSVAMHLHKFGRNRTNRQSRSETSFPAGGFHAFEEFGNIENGLHSVYRGYEFEPRVR